MRSNEGSRVPIVFLTGGTFDGDSTFRGYESGAVDFLFKPIHPRVLRSKVGVFVELYQQWRLLRERNAELARLLRLNQEMGAALRRAHEKAVRTSLTDELTGVANRRPHPAARTGGDHRSLAEVAAPDSGDPRSRPLQEDQ
jgi:two-component system cell cycle response regulator